MSQLNQMFSNRRSLQMDMPCADPSSTQLAYAVFGSPNQPELLQSTNQQFYQGFNMIDEMNKSSSSPSGHGLRLSSQPYDYGISTLTRLDSISSIFNSMVNDTQSSASSTLSYQSIAVGPPAPNDYQTMFSPRMEPAFQTIDHSIMPNSIMPNSLMPTDASYNMFNADKPFSSVVNQAIEQANQHTHQPAAVRLSGDVPPPMSLSSPVPLELSSVRSSTSSASLQPRGSRTERSSTRSLTRSKQSQSKSLSPTHRGHSGTPIPILELDQSNNQSINQLVLPRRVVKRGRRSAEDAQELDIPQEQLEGLNKEEVKKLKHRSIDAMRRAREAAAIARLNTWLDQYEAAHEPNNQPICVREKVTTLESSADHLTALLMLTQKLQLESRELVEQNAQLKMKLDQSIHQSNNQSNNQSNKLMWECQPLSSSSPFDIDAVNEMTFNRSLNHPAAMDTSKGV